MHTNNECDVSMAEFGQVQKQASCSSGLKSCRTDTSRMKGSPIKKMNILCALMLLVIGSIPAQAALITFNATGDPDVTGYVQFDDSFFLGGILDQVSNTAISDLSITVSGVAFSLGNVNTQGNTFVNSSGLVPTIVNGGGPLAYNGARAIFFFPDGSGGTTSDGDASLAFSEIPQTYTVHAVRWELANNLYFPHVDTSLPWQTEIAIINTGNQPVTGTLRALSGAGQLVETKAVSLPAHGRKQIAVATEFTNHTSIGYIVFDTDSTTVQGYTKFYQAGLYRAAIPAVKEVNTSDIYISHIDSSAQWWTGVSLVNTTSATKELTITFDDGQSRNISLTAHQHRAFTIRELFNNQPQPSIKSAVIANASGVIGLELFGTNDGKQLEGIPVTDKTASALYYPHVDSNGWWTGIVAYNPSISGCTITITPYTAQGAPLSPINRDLTGKETYVGVVTDLGLPAQTAWFKIDATSPIIGFELFGTADGNQLAAYAGGNGTGAKSGVFAKIEKTGWTGIAFVNTEAGAASVTLTAYNDAGEVVATQVLPPLGGHAKVVNLAEEIFAQDINGATYIAYSSDRNVVGFQLNGTSDDMMLDGLPALAGTTITLLHDDFNGSIVNASNWHIPTWVSPTDGTFVGQTQFRCSQNAMLSAASNSNAIIALDTYNPTGSSFYGTDLICNQSFALRQGITVTVRAKMDAPIPAGIVGGIFLYAPPAGTSNTLHDEIDFELLSNDPNNVWTNIYGNEPLGAGHPASYSYASGSATDYHIYQIQWLPNQVSWYVDGILVRTVTTQSPIPAGPMYLHFNMWVPGSDFAAAFDHNLHWTSLPSSNQTFSMSVDWITVQ